MAKPILRIENLGMCFGDKLIFRGISLEARVGESVALRGPNGSGKTTMLRCLTTLTLPSEGDAWIGDRSVKRDLRAVKELIGWVPAMDGGFFPRLNGEENLGFFGALRKFSAKEVRRKIAPWLSFEPVRLAMATPYYLCSSGMKQSLHLVRALLSEPQVLFLDEPTRSLDTETAAALRRMLKETSESRLVFFSTHSPETFPASHEIVLGRGNAA